MHIHILTHTHRHTLTHTLTHTHTITLTHIHTHSPTHTSIMHKSKHRAEEATSAPVSLEEQQADTGTYEKYVVAPRMFKALVGEIKEMEYWFNDMI